jgi:hypothetical protein
MLIHFRMLLYYPLSGLLALFANTLQNPQDPQAASDLKLMDIVISYIAEPVIHVSQHTAVAARIFIELVNVARKLVEKTLLQGSKPAKRGHDEGDPRKDNLSMLPAHSGASEALSESNVTYNSPSSVVCFSGAHLSESILQSLGDEMCYLLTRRYRLMSFLLVPVY